MSGGQWATSQRVARYEAQTQSRERFLTEMDAMFLLPTVPIVHRPYFPDANPAPTPLKTARSPLVAYETIAQS